MKPSEWLEANLWPDRLYVESKLDALRVVGISRVDVVLGGMFWPLKGRHMSVPLMSPAEAIRYARTQHLDVEGLRDDGERLVFGFQVVTAVWGLVRPILVEMPPSAFESEFEERFRVDLAAIRRYGF